MIPQLAGQSIGSIRRVWFASTAAAHAPDTCPAAALRGTADTIEIETKGGRYVHLVADTDADSVLLVAGPTAPPTGGPPHRQWADLTAILPAAFDGRPRIVAVTPVGPRSEAPEPPAARAWRIDLSTGAVLLVHRSPRNATVTIECQ